MYKIKNNSRNKQKRSKKLLAVLFVALLIAAAVFAFLKFQDQNSVAPSDEKETVATNTTEEEESVTPTKSPTTRPTTKSTRDGGAVDTNGEGVTETARPNTSTSGKITVYSPATNGFVKSGGSLTGSSTLSSVNYRLIDDQVGVIGSGTLKVVNGKFSGTFSFSSAGKEGRLDVFRTLNDGREVDVVEIPVRYQ